MYSDLHLMLYEQQERERERRLRLRQAVLERAEGGAVPRRAAPPFLARDARRPGRLKRLLSRRGVSAAPGSTDCASD